MCLQRDPGLLTSTNTHAGMDNISSIAASVFLKRSAMEEILIQFAIDAESMRTIVCLR